MAQIINLNDSAPAAPANAKNGKWQKGATTGVDPSTGLPIYPASVYFDAATISSLGLVFPDNVGIGIDATGKLSLLGNPVFYKGDWSGTGLYNVGDVVRYAGNNEAYICISKVDESVAPGVVQSAIGQGTSKAFASNVTAGNLLAVLVGAHSPLVTPTDTLGTAYSLIESNGGGGLFGSFGSLYIGVAPSSGANTVSQGTNDTTAIAIAEFRGVTTVLNAHTSNINVSSLSLTTTQPAMIIIGRVEHGGTADTYTGTGGVTIAVQQSDPGGGRSLALGYVQEGSAGSYTPGLSGTASSNPVLLAGAFLDGAVTPDQDTQHWLALGTVEPTASGNKVLASPADGSSAQMAPRVLVSADLPVATTSQLGAVKPDGTSIGISAGLISVQPATTSQLGGVKPDGTSIKVSSGVISCARQVIQKSANYTAVALDSGNLLVFLSASAVTLTLPATVPANGWFIHVQNIGAGTLSISPGSAQLDGSGSSLSVATGQGLLIGTDGSNYYTERGMGSGGGGGMTNPMTTAGDLIIGGTPSGGVAPPTRLAASSTAGLVLTSNGAGAAPSYQAVSAGGGVGGNGVFSYTAPVLANFSWVNQGTATATQNGNTVFLVAPPVSGDQYRCLVKSIPSSPTTITIWFASSPGFYNYMQTGLVLRESSSGKMVNWAIVMQPSQQQLTAAKLNSSTSFNAIYSAINIGMRSDGFGLRIRIASGTRYFDYSTDGLNWVNLYSISNTDFITPDQVGFYANSNNTTAPAFMSLLSYTET